MLAFFNSYDIMSICFEYQTILNANNLKLEKQKMDIEIGKGERVTRKKIPLYNL